MKYTLTIKDNETGETLVDEKCEAIIGGACTGAENSSFVFTHCKMTGILSAMEGATRAIERTSADRNVQIAKAIAEILENEKDGEDDE